MAAEFEFFDGDTVTRPFKNKKLQPFMIAGVIGVCLLVIFRKGGGSSGTETEYQATYASNTGVTTEVSNMLESYKETVNDMIASQSEAQTEQMEGYMEQLNSMFDSKMESYDYELQQQQAAVEEQLKQQQEQLTNSIDRLSNNISIIRNQQEIAQQQAVERSNANKASGVVKNYTSNKSSGMKSYEDYNVTNGRETNYNDDGTAYLTQGLFDLTADMSGNNSYSKSIYRDHATKYYFEDASGRTYDSAVLVMEQRTDDSGNAKTTLQFEDGTSSTIERTNAGSVTETITTRPDGTKLVTYSPNKK